MRQKKQDIARVVESNRLEAKRDIVAILSGD
jgi:hypothetical protein